MSKTIRLTKGYETIIDDEDVEYVNQHSWYVYKKIKNNIKYAVRQIGKTNIYLHRVIAERMGVPTLKRFRIKHRNGNGLDNRRKNLIVMNRYGKTYSKNLQTNNTSGITGVWRSKETGKWRARIKYNKRIIHLGYFDTKEEAIIARKEAELKYFGEMKQ